MVYLLYNPRANSGQDGCVRKSAAEHFVGQPIKLIDVTELSYKEFFAALDPMDEVVLLGGDGTIHYFLRETAGIEVTNRVMIYKAGTGNDFLRDVVGADAEEGVLVELNPYIAHLPTVTVLGNTYRFINNVAFGLDGQVVTKAEEAKAAGAKAVNYTTLAIRCLLQWFKPGNVKVTVDGGEPLLFKKVWLATTMNGRYYGGGMMLAPEQDRRSDEITCVVFHGSGRLKTLAIFPKIFTGEHVKYTQHITVLRGRSITVECDRPQDVQIEGELIRDVLSYTAEKAPRPLEAAEEVEEAVYAD